MVEREAREAGVELRISPHGVALGLSALCNGLAVERLADPHTVPNEAFMQLPALLMSAAAQGSERNASH